MMYLILIEINILGRFIPGTFPIFLLSLKSKMQLTSFLILGLTARNVRAGMLRFACAQLVTENLDPYANFAPSPSDLF